MFSNIALKILDIYLDAENPRHDPINDQKDIIKYLVANEDVKALARDIALNGPNPLDNTAVIEDEDNNYIVVEGNRRICALQLLNDPEKAPDGDVPFFKRLAKNSDKIPKKLQCILFDDLNEASGWIAIRHNGLQGGIGIKNWNATQKTRHNNRINRKDSNALSLSLIDYAVDKGFLPKEKRDKIITTASRYLGNPFVRDTFGITSARSESDVMINFTCDTFDKILARFIKDLVENTVVNSRTKKEDWVKYAKSLIQDGFSPAEGKVAPHLLKECLVTSHPLGTSTSKITDESTYQPNNTSPMQGNNDDQGYDDQGSNTDISSDLSFEDNPDEESKQKPEENDNNDSQGNSSSQPKGFKNPDTRKYIIPSSFQPPVKDNLLKRSIAELKQLPIDDLTLATAVVTRVFLEKTYILYLEHINGRCTDTKANIMLEKIVSILEKKRDILSRTELGGLGSLRRVNSQQNNVLSPKTLGTYAHGASYPNPTLLKREFDNIAPILLYMLREIAKG